MTTWSAVSLTLRRPYPVTIPMVTLMLLVPCYLLIANRAAVGTVHSPQLPWDRALPLLPIWAVIYGALYMFLIVLPVIVVREEAHIRRTFWAYLAVWITAYVCFLVYPTVAPRPPEVVGDGFAVWGLRFLYDADPPYNCFPSLHVAHSFVSALTCYRLHRRLGHGALLCASLVAISTLFTKQHYIADVLAGSSWHSSPTPSSCVMIPAGTFRSSTVVSRRCSRSRFSPWWASASSVSGSPTSCLDKREAELPTHVAGAASLSRPT